MDNMEYINPIVTSHNVDQGSADSNDISINIQPNHNDSNYDKEDYNRDNHNNFINNNDFNNNERNGGRNINDNPGFISDTPNIREDENDYIQPNIRATSDIIDPVTNTPSIINANTRIDDKINNNINNPTNLRNNNIENNDNAITNNTNEYVDNEDKHSYKNFKLTPNSAETYIEMEGYSTQDLKPGNKEIHRYTDLLTSEPTNLDNVNGIQDENKDEYNEVDLYQFVDDTIDVRRRSLPDIPNVYTSPIPYKTSKEIDKKKKIIMLMFFILILIVIIVIALALGIYFGTKNNQNTITYVAGVMVFPVIVTSNNNREIIYDFTSITHNCLNSSSPFESNFISAAVPATSITTGKTRYVIVLTMKGEYRIDSLSHYLTNDCYIGYADSIGYLECLNIVPESYLTNVYELPCNL